MPIPPNMSSSFPSPIRAVNRLTGGGSTPLMAGTSPTGFSMCSGGQPNISSAFNSSSSTSFGESRLPAIER
eukprot:13689564-Heterocapsa_arctica.AAC.1